MNKLDTIGSICEFIPEHLYFVSLKKKPKPTSGIYYFCTDREFMYDRFNFDFGPLNLGLVFKFWCKLESLLDCLPLANHKIVYYTRCSAKTRANAAFLIGCYAILRLNKTPEETYNMLVVAAADQPFRTFRDAGFGSCSYKLTLLDCFRAMKKAQDNGFFDFYNFDISQYEYYDKVHNGDLHWVIPNKILAFSGPQRKTEIDENGNLTFSPGDYVPILQNHNVSTIIRLNQKKYNANTFVRAGFEFYDLYFEDGTVPSNKIIQKFLKIAESPNRTIAVHCKAGLGRTGTLICCYLMKHYKFTAAEAIAWNRITRPGSVLGRQQNFLEEKQDWLWHEGDLYREEEIRKNNRPWLSKLVLWVQEVFSPDNKNTNSIHYQENHIYCESSAVSDSEETQGDKLNKKKRRHCALNYDCEISQAKRFKKTVISHGNNFGNSKQNTWLLDRQYCTKYRHGLDRSTNCLAKNYKRKLFMEIHKPSNGHLHKYFLRSCTDIKVTAHY